MSIEIFPTRSLRAADFIDRPLEGFEWRQEGDRASMRVLRRLPEEGSVVVYIGNGRYSRPRGFKRDAVWFEAFGLGIGSYGRRLGQFFLHLGQQIDRLDGGDGEPIAFVTDLGATITPEGGEDDADWDDERHVDALEAMQATPGSTTRYFKGPTETGHPDTAPFVPIKELP